MAKEIRLGVKVEDGPQKGEEGFFILRQPTPAELDTFRTRVREYLQQGDQTFANLARAEFFDLLLQRVENFTGKDGSPITPDRKSEIPVTRKKDLIFFAFEDKKGVEFLKTQGVHYGSSSD